MTPSRQPFIKLADVKPGTFVAAMGADGPEKGDLDPGLAASKLVVDVVG